MAEGTRRERMILAKRRLILSRQLYGDFTIALSKNIRAVRRFHCSMNVVQPRTLIVVYVLGSLEGYCKLSVGQTKPVIYIYR